jgi:uncharacterized membrane protein (UPF0127 family)
MSGLRIQRSARAALSTLFLIVALTAPTIAQKLERVEIVTRSGVHVFDVELALTADERSKGLMFRKELAEGRGMLFDFEGEGPIMMWMKNTYVSLDMLFFDPDGRITHIHRRAKTLSEDIISSGGTVGGVLEILAGEADRRGIRVGDRMVLPRLR